MNKLSIAILGASGYTGVELIRLLHGHPAAAMRLLTGDRQAGRDLAEVFPSLSGLSLPRLVKIEDADFAGIDVVFCCLPHATTQQVIQALPQTVKVVDLSADFRLADIATYEQWYGPHHAPELQASAVYGLTEWFRADVAQARLVANPGCYPTASLLPLFPLLRAGVIDPAEIIIDAKSGVSGAGRSLRETSLAAEVQEGIMAYGIGKHRHLPEIEQGCARAQGAPVQLTFTPHLMPMNRGILATLYVRGDVARIRAALTAAYADAAFVQVLPEGQAAQTRSVRGSNRCHISVHADGRPGRVVIVSVIDNLVKGASGQAVQNMNVMFGLPEATGLAGVGVFP
jgi:N-acetyl-gamma-glutamyl-phosphate reductase